MKNHRFDHLEGLTEKNIGCFLGITLYHICVLQENKTKIEKNECDKQSREKLNIKVTLFVPPLSHMHETQEVWL